MFLTDISNAWIELKGKERIMRKTHCVVCGQNLDGLFWKASDHAKYCSNRCRQKAYRERCKLARTTVTAQDERYASEVDENALTEREKALVSDIQQNASNGRKEFRGPGGLHRSPKTTFSEPNT